MLLRIRLSNVHQSMLAYVRRECVVEAYEGINSILVKSEHRVVVKEGKKVRKRSVGNCKHGFANFSGGDEVFAGRWKSNVHVMLQ